MRIGLYKVCLYVVITRRVSWKNIIDIVFVTLCVRIDVSEA